jgi:hypothetical protein
MILRPSSWRLESNGGRVQCYSTHDLHGARGLGQSRFWRHLVPLVAPYPSADPVVPIRAPPPRPTPAQRRLPRRLSVRHKTIGFVDCTQLLVSSDVSRALPAWPRRTSAGKSDPGRMANSAVASGISSTVVSDFIPAQMVLPVKPLENSKHVPRVELVTPVASTSDSHHNRTDGGDKLKLADRVYLLVAGRVSAVLAAGTSPLSAYSGRRSPPAM